MRRTTRRRLLWGAAALLALEILAPAVWLEGAHALVTNALDRPLAVEGRFGDDSDGGGPYRGATTLAPGETVAFLHGGAGGIALRVEGHVYSQLSTSLLTAFGTMTLTPELLAEDRRMDVMDVYVSFR